jgi:hypothetical protein
MDCNCNLCEVKPRLFRTLFYLDAFLIGCLIAVIRWALK